MFIYEFDCISIRRTEAWGPSRNIHFKRVYLKNSGQEEVSRWNIQSRSDPWKIVETRNKKKMIICFPIPSDGKSCLRTAKYYDQKPLIHVHLIHWILRTVFSFYGTTLSLQEFNTVLPKRLQLMYACLSVSSRTTWGSLKAFSTEPLFSHSIGASGESRHVRGSTRTSLEND